MTRLQSRSASCECRKTTKESESFVTENKIYETRSSGRKGNQIIYSRRRSKKQVNVQRNAQRNLYINKVNGSRMPIKNNRNFDESKSKNYSTKKCDEKITSNGNARKLIDNALDGLITRKLKMEMIDSKCIGPKPNSISVSLSPKEFLSDDSNEVVSNIEVIKQEVFNEIQNGGDNLLKENVNNGDENMFDSIVEENPINEKSLHPKEEIVDCCTMEISNKAPVVNEEIHSSTNGHYIPDESAKDTELTKKGRKKKKTQIQSLLEAYDEINISSLSEKRPRKRPENFSPPIKRKIQFEEFPSTEKLTLSGKIKKKCGPKRKPKGPVLHYLDLYMKNKNQDITKTNENADNTNHLDDVDSNTLPDVSNIHTNQTTNHLPSSLNDNNVLNSTTSAADEKIPLATTPSNNTKNNSPISYKNSIILNIARLCAAGKLINGITKNLSTVVPDNHRNDQVLPMRSCESEIEACRKPKKPRVKKQKKIKTKPFDKTIQKILGYRRNKGNNEILVLFENGTSNWIEEEVDGTKYFDRLDDFYEHFNQDVPVIHRIGYQITQQVKRKRVCDESESDSCSESEEEDNIICDKNMFLGNVPLPVHIPSTTYSMDCNITRPFEETGINDNANLASKSNSVRDSDTCNTTSENLGFHLPTIYPDEDINVMSSSDLNELCRCVMSSRHNKLYPYETTKEIVIKSDGEFVHIYLKRFKKLLSDGSKKCEDHLNLKVCECLINSLEESASNDNCNVVVISGIEDYFALNSIFDKMLKSTPSVERNLHEQDTSILRYLVQTIRNFDKPIVAVIRKAATGLPASLLSLFDMVFDERSTNGIKTPKKSRKLSKSKPEGWSSPRTPTRSQVNCSTDDSTTDDQAGPESFQNYVFPRLMGLTDRNEAHIMGEQPTPCLDSAEDIVSTAYNNKTLSQPLRSSVRNMKNTSNIRSRSRGESLSSGTPSQHNHTVDASEKTKKLIDNLEEQVKAEKDLTLKSMEEFSSFLKSIE